MKKNQHELIFVLVNQGFTDIIMDEARKHGARGGTIIASRGGANSDAEKNYGVDITASKELLLILVSHSVKTNVINAIYKVCGVETKGMGVIWTVPADNIVGMHQKAEEKPAKKAEKKPAKKNKK